MTIYGRPFSGNSGLTEQRSVSALRRRHTRHSRSAETAFKKTLPFSLDAEMAARAACTIDIHSVSSSVRTSSISWQPLRCTAEIAQDPSKKTHGGLCTHHARGHFEHGINDNHFTIYISILLFTLYNEVTQAWKNIIQGT